MDVRPPLEEELKRRGIPFSIDAESGRHAVEINGQRGLVWLDNLQRAVAVDGDMGRIARFVDAVVAGRSEMDWSADRLYWSLEPGDYLDRPDYTVAVSGCVDRVLVHLSDDGRLVSWVTPTMLGSLSLSEADAGARAFTNLARALTDASVECQDVDGVQLGFIGTELPFKASLILAPNLREVVEPVLGWPLMAVVPDRNFLYLWAARHTEFVRRVGGVVVREYSQAAYPISTEVYEITDQAVQAVGAFPKKSPA